MHFRGTGNTAKRTHYFDTDDKSMLLQNFISIIYTLCQCTTTTNVHFPPILPFLSVLLHFSIHQLSGVGVGGVWIESSWETTDELHVIETLPLRFEPLYLFSSPSLYTNQWFKCSKYSTKRICQIHGKRKLLISSNDEYVDKQRRYKKWERDVQDHHPTQYPDWGQRGASSLESASGSQATIEKSSGSTCKETYFAWRNQIHPPTTTRVDLIK